jgi:hypothetical protein
MTRRFHTYTAYSIGVAVAGAIVLAITVARANKDGTDSILRVFGGFVIGWLSATIARAVYPPPKSRQRVGTTS